LGNRKKPVEYAHGLACGHIVAWSIMTDVPGETSHFEISSPEFGRLSRFFIVSVRTDL
jgi:hypothetical protein